MQRQLYPALLLITIALAAALYLRPTVGEELMALAGVQHGRGLSSSGQGGEPSQASVFPTGLPAASSQPTVPQAAASWASPASGEAFAGDAPALSTPPATPYPEAGARQSWAPQKGAYSDPPRVGLPPQASQSLPAGQDPADGSAGRLSVPPMDTLPEPRSAGAAQAWQDYGPPASTGQPSRSGDPQAREHYEPPLGRYPQADAARGSGTIASGQMPSYSGPATPYPGYDPGPSGYPSYAGPSGAAPYVATQPPGPSQPQPEYRSAPVEPRYGMSAAAPPSTPSGYPADIQNRPAFGTPYSPPNPAVASPRPPGPADYGAPVVEQPPRQGRVVAATPVPEATLCEGARTLARVGTEVILASEVMPAYQEIISKIPESRLAALPASRVELEKKALLSKLLEERIQTKLLYLEAKRSIPEEGFPDLERRISKHFEEEEVPRRIEKAGVDSRRELEEKLHGIGTSLDRVKRQFIEQSLASQWLHQENDRDPAVSHQDMFDYYQEHIADFETAARARWERLSVRKPRYGDPQEARARLAQMGNQIMQGMSVADVLKAQAGQEPECNGGVQGWITQGSLEVPQTTEQAIFGLPVGRPSQIFEDGDCFHIVRVLEREDAKRTEFGEAQSGIREKLQSQRWQAQVTEYLAGLKKQTPVWTVFDDDPELAELRRQVDAARK